MEDLWWIELLAHNVSEEEISISVTDRKGHSRVLRDWTTDFQENVNLKTFKKLPDNSFKLMDWWLAKGCVVTHVVVCCFDAIVAVQICIDTSTTPNMTTFGISNDWNSQMIEGHGAIWLGNLECKLQSSEASKASMLPVSNSVHHNKNPNLPIQVSQTQQHAFHNGYQLQQQS